MSRSETHAQDETKDETYWLPCESCHGETQHVVRSSVDTHDQNPDEDMHVVNHFQIVECLGCRWLSFRHSWSSSDDFEHDGEGNAVPAGDHVALYPPRLRDWRPLAQDHYLPAEVYRIYREAQFAMRNQQPILAGIGIRAIVEAVCAERKATGKNLEVKIDSLVTLGTLTADGAEILHGTRLLGNAAAHEVAPPESEDLLAAMQVAEHLLQTVYILPRIARHLPKPKPKPQPKPAKAGKP